MFDSRTLETGRGFRGLNAPPTPPSVSSRLRAALDELARSRFRGLGDAAPQQCQGQSQVTGTGTTDYACGFLRGWQRIFTRNGSFITIDPRSQGGQVVPVQPQPTMQEWAAFDAQAQQLGVGGLTAQLVKNATPDQGLLSQVSRNLSQIGQGIASGQLDKSAKGALALTGTTSNALDKLIPGSGGIIVDGILGAIFPLIPILPGLAGVLATQASYVPGVGDVLSSLAKTAAQGAFAPSNGAFAMPAKAQSQIGGSIFQSLTSSVAQGVADLSPLKDTLVRLQQSYQDTNGNLVAKLEATATEALNELSFAVTLCTIVAPASLALTGLSLTVTALKAAHTVANALAVAAALKKAEAAARSSALVEESKVDAQILALQQEIARIKAQTLALQRGATPAGTPSGTAKAAGLVLLAVALGKAASS